MTKVTTSKETRRSKRQLGIEVTHLEVKTTKRGRKPGQLKDKPDEVVENEEAEQQEASQPQAEPPSDQPEETELEQEAPLRGVEQETDENGEKIDAGQNGEDKEGEEDETVHNSGEECLTAQSKKKKRTRGPTRMSKVAKSHEEKVEVEFNSLGEHVGKGSVTLSSFLGPLVREHVPVLLDDWRGLDDKTKDTMWEEIQGRFNLTEDLQKSCVFRQMGCIWRASKSRLVSKLRSTKSKDTIRKLKPNNIHNDAAWIKWVKSRTGQSFKERSDQFKTLRNNQIPHTTSRKGMIRLAHELKKKAFDPAKVTRSKIWIAGHTHADGRAVRPKFEATIEQIKSLDSEIGSNSNGSIKEDAVSQILGKDKSGRVRGMGRGITASKLAFLQARDAHVQKIEAKQAELVIEIADLKHIVRDLTAGKQDYGSNSDTTDKSNCGPRCQLLDWYSNEEIVVADGELCSTEPTYKIGRIPIGPDAAAVVVKFASDKEAYVWRPTTTVTSIGQAVGTKIAWPFDKLILDNIDSPTVNKTAGSATNLLVDRIQILDWNFGDQVIAEGHMISTDAKQLVNGIPLGPKAAIVKIDTVINKEAYLWRPSEDMTVMGDALFHNIAWPIWKVLMDNIQASGDELSESESDPKVPERPEPSIQNGARAFASKGAGASCSKGAEASRKSTSNSSNNSPPYKKKCLLLDCFGSGKTVAEGRVCSTNPTDIVHFVPLGLNASKVWVDVCKIGDARVWRPTSEFEIVADALGTTVAWPNENIVFI